MEDNAVLKKEAPTDKPPREPWSKKTKIIVWSIVGAVVIAAIVIGIVFGVRANQYKMRTFKKDGVTYEQYNIEIDTNENTILRTPRGEFPFLANYDVNSNPKLQFAYLLSGNPERYKNYRVILSKQIKNVNSKLKQPYITHAIVWENDHKMHYYDNFFQAKYAASKKSINRQAKKISKNKNMVVVKHSENPIITGTVEFDPGVLLYVNKGIVTGYQINGQDYYFNYS